jgi:hypothetical protein
VKHLLDRERAARDVAGVLEEHAVARHQRRGGGAEHLPEGEIPRHHGEHDADRVEGDERLAAADIGGLVGQVFFGVVPKPVAMERALFDFGAAVIEGLAHFLGHQPREFLLPRAEVFGRFVDHRRPLAETGPAPIQKRRVRRLRRRSRVVDRVRVVALDRLAGRRIDRLQPLGRCLRASELSLFSHGRSPWFGP